MISGRIAICGIDVGDYEHGKSLSVSAPHHEAWCDKGEPANTE